MASYSTPFYRGSFAMKNILKALLNIGVSSQLLPSDVKHVKLVNALSVFSFFTIISTVPVLIHYFPESKWILLFNCLMPLFYAGVLILNRKRQYLIARLIFNFSGFLFISWSSYQLGPDVNAHLCLILVIVTAFFVYPKREKAYQYFIITVASISFITIEAIFRFTSPPVEFSPEFLKLIGVNVNIVMLIFISGFLYYISEGYKRAEESLDLERQKSDSLLHNVLPEKIVHRLKSNPKAIADSFNQTSILFADIVNFTPLSEKIDPNDLVAMLNVIFSKFDDLAEKHGLEKIKTIGDAYMVAAGIPEKHENHAEAIAEMALDMNEDIEQLKTSIGTSLRLRIGINSGPVIAGVIGKKKFIYDLWGDTVNTASRMESHGASGEIQVTEQTYNLLKDKYNFVDRGQVDIKGKGIIKTFFLKNKKF